MSAEKTELYKEKEVFCQDVVSQKEVRDFEKRVIDQLKSFYQKEYKEYTASQRLRLKRHLKEMLVAYRAGGVGQTEVSPSKTRRAADEVQRLLTTHYPPPSMPEDSPVPTSLREDGLIPSYQDAVEGCMTAENSSVVGQKTDDVFIPSVLQGLYNRAFSDRQPQSPSGALFAANQAFPVLAPSSNVSPGGSSSRDVNVLDTPLKQFNLACPRRVSELDGVIALYHLDTELARLETQIDRHMLTFDRSPGLELKVSPDMEKVPFTAFLRDSLWRPLQVHFISPGFLSQEHRWFDVPMNCLAVLAAQDQFRNGAPAIVPGRGSRLADFFEVKVTTQEANCTLDLMPKRSGGDSSIDPGVLSRIEQLLNNPLQGVFPPADSPGGIATPIPLGKPVLAALFTYGLSPRLR